MRLWLLHVGHLAHHNQTHLTIAIQLSRCLNVSIVFCTPKCPLIIKMCAWSKIDCRAAFGTNARNTLLGSLFTAVLILRMPSSIDSLSNQAQKYRTL